MIFEVLSPIKDNFFTLILTDSQYLNYGQTVNNSQFCIGDTNA